MVLQEVNMPLHPKEDFELIRDMLNWIQQEGIAYEEYGTQWKKELAREIQELIRIYENKKVKFESVYRNVNRMISYYYETGAQARSGKKYLKYLEIIFEERYQTNLMISQSLGHGIAHRFLSLEDARVYAEDVPNILKIYPDTESKLWVIMRYPSQPLSA
jgi:hypothetical protein